MNSIKELIQMGYSFRIYNGELTYKFWGVTPPDPNTIKQIFSDVKNNKSQAIDFIKNCVIEKEIDTNRPLELSIQNFINQKYNEGISWERLDVFTKTQRLVLTGVKESVNQT